jgi:hypothetical protein
MIGMTFIWMSFGDGSVFRCGRGEKNVKKDVLEMSHNS